MLGLGLSFFGRSAPIAAAGFDVFLVAGQSNVYFGTPKDAGIDVSHPDVFQWGRISPNNNIIILAEEPLDHVSPGSGIGFALAMIRDYYIPNGHLAAGRDVLLVPAALSGTGFGDNRWNPGDDLYEDAVLRVNTAISENPGSAMAGILWHQGENDVNRAAYLDELDAMIAGMRADITSASSTTPFILGGMVPFWVDNNPDRRVTQGHIHGTLKRLAFTGYADPEIPTVIEKASPTVDEIHYDAPTQRQLAERYYIGWLAAPSNTDVSAPSFSFDTDLVGYWRFETGSFEDRAGLNDPIIVGDPLLVWDTNFDEIVFSSDGSDYARTNLQLPASYTKSIWAKVTGGSSFRNAFSNHGISGGTDHYLYVSSGSPPAVRSGHASGFNDVVSTTGMATDTWYHLVLTYDEASTTMTLYIDGVEEDQNTGVTGGGGSGLDNVSMGAADGANTWVGQLRHARIYDRELAAAEVLEIYDAEK